MLITAMQPRLQKKGDCLHKKKMVYLFLQERNHFFEALIVENFGCSILVKPFSLLPQLLAELHGLKKKTIEIRYSPATNTNQQPLLIGANACLHYPR